MYNLYTNSTIHIRSRASLSLSFNDPQPHHHHHPPSSPYSNTSCCSYRSSSTSCSCCCCCNCCSSSPPLINARPPLCQTSISRIVPVNPSLLYGLRQSTLIQWPPCRRRSILTTTRFDRPCYGATIYDLGRTTRSSFYGNSFVCCAKGKDSEGESKRDRKCTKKGQWGSGRRRVFEHKNEIISRRESAAREDAESILSLLTEDVDEKLLVEIRETKRVEKGSSARKKKLLTTQRENAVGREGSKGRKVKEGRVCVRPPSQRDSRVEIIDSVRVTRHSNVEDYNRRRDERFDVVKGEDWRTRKGGSSCSSYYICSDPEHDYVSDEAEVQAKHDSVYKLEGSIKAKKDSRKRVGVVITEQGNAGSSESHRLEKDKHLESSCRRSNDVKIGSSAEWDWRKKSEKKLSEESSLIENTKFRNNSATAVDQSKSSMAYASGSAKALSSKTQSNYRGDVLISGVNAHEESRELFSRTGIRGSSDSRYNYERVTQSSDNRNQRISNVSNQFAGKKENMGSCAYCETCGQRTTDDKNQISSSFKQAKVLDYQEMNAGSTSAEQLASEFRSSRREENSGLLKSSVNQYDVQRIQEHHTLVPAQQANVSRASLKDSSIVNVARVSTEDSSSDQQAKYSQIETSSAFTGLSETRIKNRHEEQNSTSLQTSVKDGNHHQQHDIDQPFFSGQINIIRQNQMQTRITNFGESYAENTSNTQQVMGMHKHSGETSSSLAPFQPAKALQNPVGASVVLQSDSKTGVEGASITYGGNFEHGMYDEHIHLREKVKTLEHHRIKKHELINERIKQSNLSYETQGPIREAGFLEGVAIRRRQPSLASTSQIRVEEVSEEERGEKSWKRILPSSQTTNRDNELASEFTRGDSSRSPGQPSQASSSQIRVEEIEDDEDAQESLVRRLPSHRSTKGYPVSVDLAGGYIRTDSGWSSQQLPQTLSSQVGVEEIQKEEDERNSQVEIPPPGDHTVERHPDFVESASGLTRQDYGQSSEGGPSIFFYPETATPAPVQDKAGGIGTFKEPPYLIPDVDVIGSAKRMEQVSLEVAEEFLENARHQASASLNQVEGTLPQRQTVHGSLQYEEKMFNQSGPESSQLNQDAGHTSGGSREYDKGPADAMWSLTDPALIEIPKKESSDQDAGSTPGNTAVQTRGRSLWNVLGNIIRLRWDSHADSHTAAAESGVKTSSDDSASTATEAWFDPDETHVSDRIRVPPSVAEELSSSAGQPSMRAPVQSRMKGSAMMSSDDTSGVASLNASSSTGLGSSLASGADILGESIIDLDAGEQTSTGITSADMSLPLVSQLGRPHRRSQAIHDMSLEGKGVIGGVQAEQVDQSHHLRLEGVSMLVEADAEMRQGKLLRSKQVMRERFDEWEEAYRWESHQRKVDEIFMREALVEAKKAADLWEVPVGAVLVQDGKIIARGHNLVEELRDSTAHAEMICIREASNALRTWRLSEAKLYVTLEPCPMCAGAILQARITTLVYGAPNKLLGADGSWIRLFPGNAEGEGTVGPVHPFHPNMIIRRGILQEECADAMQQFFQLRRKKDKKKSEESGQPSITKITLHPSKMMHKMRHMFHLFCL